jgi:hypothetical protein
MSPGPIPGSGRDEDPARRRADPGDPGRDQTGWMDDDLWVDLELAEDSDCGPPVLDAVQLDELLAGAREITTGSFSTGGPLDGSPGCTGLMGFADEAAGTDDRYTGRDDDELIGAICAWDKVEAHAAARKHAAVAELARRRPEESCDLPGTAAMPLVWDEFVPAELGWALAESRWAAENILGLAYELQVKLPGTAAAFRSGLLRQGKVEIIARAADPLDHDEARAVEAQILGRAAKLTPGGLRAAVAKAVMQVAPDKARKRREEATKDARVERWAEDSGNAALAGRELPPAEVLAADQRITWWAEQLKAAGLEGDMDVLRARAYLDILLGMDSRPSPPLGGPEGQQGPADADPGRPDGGPDGRTDPGDAGPDGPGSGRPGPAGPDGSPPRAAGGPGGLPPGLSAGSP